MSVSKSRRSAGERPAAPNPKALGKMIRKGLLCSTALVGASLAASGAMAQTFNPTGGGTIVISGGGTTTDSTGSGGGFGNVGGTGITITDVNIINTTGSPTANAVNFTRSSFSSNGDGAQLFGTNTLVAAPGGSAFSFVSTGGNNTGIGFHGTLNATGLNGVVISTSGAWFHSGAATFNLTAQTAGQGSGLLATAGSCICDSSFTGAFNASNFQYGANLNAGTGINFTTGAGGSITGVQTGIRAVTTTNGVDLSIGSSISASSTGISATSDGGAANVTATGAIIAPSGIIAIGAGGVTVTTSGGGTINSTVAGTGTGITATGTSASAALNINVGAAIGGTNAPQIGVHVTSAGGAITFANTAAIRGTTVGLRLSRPVGSVSGTVNVGADIIGGIDASSGVQLTYTVAQGATVSGAFSSSFGVAALTTNNSGTVLNNAGSITSTSVAVNSAGVLHLSGGSVNNTATGVISGRTGVSGFNNSVPTTNAGSIIGTGTSATEAGIVTNGGLITNSGSILGAYNGIRSIGNLLTLNNQANGTVTGAVDAVSAGGSSARLAITNTGIIQTLGGVGGTGSSGVLLNSVSTQTSTITNSGTIAGGSDATNGYGVNIADGILTLTNQSGGSITGGTGGIRLASDDLATLNLNAGSTVTGSIVSTNTGARTTVLAGLLTGGYDAGAGTGIDTFTLASTGSITGAVNLGGGDDIFNWQGGTFTTINAGSGSDIFNSALGIGVSGTLDQANLSGFESYRHLSGTLLVNGSRSVGDAWQVTSGASIDLAGSITSLSGTGQAIIVNGNTAGSSVNVRSGAAINAWNGVWFNGAGTYTFANAGTITASGGYAFMSNGATSFTNSGSITAAQHYAVTFGNGLSTVTNSGVIAGGASATTGIGIRGGSGGLTASNGAGGIIAGGFGAISSANGLTLTNAGMIGVGSVDGSGVYTFGGTGFAIDFANGGTISNSGTIRGGGSAIHAPTASVNLTNRSTGLIEGGLGFAGGIFQDAVVAAGGTILNAGAITTNTRAGTLGEPTYSAIYWGATGGTITNAASGSLTGGTESLFGTAIQARGVTTFNNYGSATGGASAGSGFRQFNDQASTINLHAGSVTGSILTGSANDILSIYSGRGTAGAATVDGPSGLTLQNAGTLGAAVFGVADLGGGTNILRLRGTGDGTAANGAAGTYNLSGGSVTGASILSKLDGGTWTLTGNGAGINTINAGDGGGNDGLLIFNGTSGLTADIIVNSSTVRATTTTSFGTGTLRMINPTIEFGAAGTYANDISLEVAAGQQAIDPTILRNTSGGNITLSGRIYETAGVGGANQFVTFDGAGTTFLTNTTNSWGGVTAINSGTTLSGTSATISGGSITNNGALIYSGGVGTVAQNISGTGSFTRSGAGILVLTGANSWTGVTTNGSGLQGTTGSIAGSSIVNNGGLFYVNTTAGTASQNITGSGYIDIAGTATTTFAGAITNTGQFSVSGSGASAIISGSRSGANVTAATISGTAGVLSVADGASIAGGQFIAVRMTGAGSTLNNLGSITNAGTGGDGQIGAAVYVSTTTGTTTINNGSLTYTGAGSLIQGSNAGIRHQGGSDTLVVNNYGHVIGNLYNGIENSAGNLTVSNFAGGQILGRYHGIIGGGVMNLTNAGTIYSIDVSGNGITSTGGTLVVNNLAGGQITGGARGILANGGSTTITNAGTISGSVTGITSAASLTLTKLRHDPFHWRFQCSGLPSRRRDSS